MTTQLQSANATEEQAIVTFNSFSGEMAGKTVSAVKVVKTYESTAWGRSGWETRSIQSITYLLDGMYYGEECFTADQYA